MMMIFSPGNRNPNPIGTNIYITRGQQCSYSLSMLTVAVIWFPMLYNTSVVVRVLQILSKHTERRSMGTKGKSSFSTATFVIDTVADAADGAGPPEEPPAPRPRPKKPNGVDDDRAFYTELLPDAVQACDEMVSQTLG